MDTKYIFGSGIAIASIIALLYACAPQQQSVVKTDSNLSEKKEVNTIENLSNEEELPNEADGIIPPEENKTDYSEKPLYDSKYMDAEIKSTSDEADKIAEPVILKASSAGMLAPTICASPTGLGTATFSAPSLDAATYRWEATAAPTYSIASGEVSRGYTESISTEIHAEPSVMTATERSLAGKLTAGEINDFKKWKMWEDYSEPQLAAYRSVWDMSPGERYSVLVQTEGGAPLVDCPAELIAKTGETMWQTRTDNTGKAELWGTFKGEKSKLIADKIVVYYNGKPHKIERPKTFEKSINSIRIPASCHIPDEVDICFTVDATGSMGDEIAYLQAELLDVIAKIHTNHKDIALNLGSVFYRDHGDTYVTRTSDFNKDASVINNFIAGQYADGGGDGPEAVDDALRASLFEMNWSKEARARILFMILDAPPHQEKANQILLDNCVREAAKKGVRIIPLVASGGGYDMDKSMEYLMRCCALGTNGTYAFLTNHSGIGGNHTAPSTDHYEVETLNALLLRIVGEYLTVPDCNLQQFVAQESPEDTVSVSTIIEPVVPDSLANQSDSTNNHIDPDPREIVVISCYPNPASDYIWVKTSDDVSELFLTDNSGKIMQRLTPVSRLFELDLSYYPSGIYYIKAFIRDEWITARIIVARMK